jgi:acyl carrier protein
MSPVAASAKEIPLDRSLVEIGYLDSFGIIELVDAMEKNWKIRIDVADINRERFGSIQKMAKVIGEKIAG